jgi:hypothetical protein
MTIDTQLRANTTRERFHNEASQGREQTQEGSSSRSNNAVLNKVLRHLIDMRECVGNIVRPSPNVLVLG